MYPLIEELWPFIALLYAFDAIVLVRPGHLLLVAHGSEFSIRDAGIRLLGLLPGSRSFLTHSPQIHLHDDGYFVPKDPRVDGAARYHPDTYEFLSYETIKALELEHHTLRIAGRPFKFPSKAHALAARERLMAVLALTRDQRERVITSRPDAGSLTERLQTLERLRRPLDRLTWTLALWTFVTVPLAVALEVGYRVLNGVLWVNLVLFVLTTWWTVHTEKTIQKEGLAPPRGALTPILLSPPVVARAGVALTRDVLAEFDDATLASALLPRQEAKSHLRREWFGARLALEQDGPPGWTQWWTGREAQLAELAAPLDLEESHLHEAPASQDPTAEAYCPLCHDEYRADVLTCEACDLPLRPFQSAVVEGAITSPATGSASR